MYPSVIIAHNICPSTLTTTKPLKEHRRFFKQITLDSGGEKVWVHQHVDGVLPVILRNLWNERNRVKGVMKSTDKSDPMYELLNAKQLAIKISMNSIYGIFGANVGDMAFIELSRAVCSIGRDMLKKLSVTIQKDYEMDVIYGDSVTASTPIILRDINANHVRCLSIETFWDFILLEKKNNRIQGNVDFNYRNEKEAFVFDDDANYAFQIFSDDAWTTLKRIIRHRPKSTRLYRIKVANGSRVEVTGDHSLLLSSGECITPSQIKIGDILMTKCFDPVKDDGGAILGNIQFVSTFPDFSSSVGENEIHVFDMYHAQLFIYFLGHAFVEIIASGKTFKILYNFDVNPDPFFSTIDQGMVTGITRFNVDTNAWVYDLETNNHHFSSGLGTLIVHNTDSVFVQLPTKDENTAFALSEKMADELTKKLFKKPILLEFEKIIYPFVLFKKKNYVGLKKESVQALATLEERGLISVQRSTPLCVAKIYQDVLNVFLAEGNPFIIYEMIKVYLEKILNEELPLSHFIESARLKDNYINPLNIPHARVSLAVNNRAGTKIYSSGDRVQYVRYHPPKFTTTFDLDKANVAEKVEDPNFVVSRGYKIDYRSYICQLKKAFLELAKFFPEVYSLVEELFENVLNDFRINDGVVKIKGKKKLDTMADKDKPIKKRKITSYFLPAEKKE